MRDVDEQLADRFRCPKCRTAGGQARRIATTGTGLSRLFDVQHNRFIAVSCTHCGYTEMYNPRVLGDRENLTDVLDVLFGR
jgi:predicted nucleic-acid-binding Zn-ribbon protein